MRLPLSLTLALSVNAERYWLSKIPAFPEARTFEVVHYFTIDANEKPEVSLKGPVSFHGDADLSNAQIHLIHHSAMNEVTTDHFCCSTEDVKAKKCNTPGSLILTNNPRTDAVSYKMNRSSSTTTFSPGKSGLYFLALSNCGESSLKGVSFKDGEFSVVTNTGYLPAEEYPKLNFYFLLTTIYIVLLVGWVMYCYSWSSVLFSIHYFVGWVTLCGLLEACAWYSSLMHWNYLGHRWKSMVALATCATTVKQGVSYALLLLVCLGTGVTKPKVDSKTFVQIIGLTAGFIVTDTIRQFLTTHYSVQTAATDDYSTLTVICIVAPGSFFVSCLYVWILQGLQDTIKELSDTKQSVKLSIFQSLRLALGIVLGVVIALVVYETLVVRQDSLSENWDIKWLFSDAFSHVSFVTLLVIIMYLWRPNESSMQYMYSAQIGNEEDGIELGQVGQDDDDDGEEKTLE